MGGIKNWYNCVMLQKIIGEKPYLAWDIKKEENLSEKSMLERILAYGDWDDIMEAEKILGIARMKALFEEIKSNRRVNLRPRTLNYFQNYFAKYA